MVYLSTKSNSFIEEMTDAKEAGILLNEISVRLGVVFYVEMEDKLYVTALSNLLTEAKEGWR